MMKLQKCLLTLGVLSLLAGCSAATMVNNCDGWRAIRPKASDIESMSGELVGQILTHNRFGEEVCGWKPK